MSARIPVHSPTTFYAIKSFSMSTEYKWTGLLELVLGGWFLFLEPVPSLQKSCTNTYANHITLGREPCVWCTHSIASDWGVGWEESGRPGRSRTGPSDELLHAAFQPIDEAYPRDKYDTSEASRHSLACSYKHIGKVTDKLSSIAAALLLPHRATCRSCMKIA